MPCKHVLPKKYSANEFLSLAAFSNHAIPVKTSCSTSAPTISNLPSIYSAIDNPWEADLYMYDSAKVGLYSKFESSSRYFAILYCPHTLPRSALAFKLR